MKTLNWVWILLSLSDVFTQNILDWDVNYPNNPVCAVRGFSVSIPCSYSYPPPVKQVKETLWCSMNSNTDKACVAPPYVYNGSSNTESDFQYSGNNVSDCTLLIRNVQSNYSGEYRFRFITDITGGKYTGVPGAILQVSDLKVSLIRFGGNGTLKPGDSLNLTCDVNCTHTSSQFVWMKNNERLNTSGGVLHFPALTLRDSGKYTCTWTTDVTSGSDTIRLQVEGDTRWFVWMMVSVTAGVILLVLAVPTVVYNRRRNFKAPEEKEGERGEKTQTKQKFNQVPDEEMQNQEEVTYATVQSKDKTKRDREQVNQVPDEGVFDKEGVIYASVCIKPNKPTDQHVHTEEEEEEDSVIYSAVKKA